MTTTQPAISEHDKGVLNLLFKDTVVQCKPQTRIDMDLPPDQHVPQEVVEQLVTLEKQAITHEALGEFDKAMAIFDQIIADYPLYASAYNNRAQMIRLYLPDETSTKRVIADLESSIALARPADAEAQVSKMQAQVLRNAYGQLASIYLSMSKRPENAARSWQLQLRASDMMMQSSNYGEQIAASLAISINPYARLCGNMVETVMNHYK